MKKSTSETLTERIPTGIAGLDEIIGGGIPKHRLFVIEGEPGSGKTTMALQFLLEGAKRGEKSLYITFSETEDELNAVAESHHWNLKKIELIDLSAIERQLSPESHTTLFHPSELELTQITENLLKKIDEIQPARIVFDSVSEMRLLAESPLRYRRQVLSLKQALSKRKSTVFFLDDLTSSSQDLQVQSIAHGVVRLTRLHHEFGGERRQVRILKMRGVKFISGHHDFEINTGGVEVYPRMISSQHEETIKPGFLESGVKELDLLLGGGLDRGTTNLFLGPAGSGKSTMSLLFALSAIRKGEKVAFFSFDETIANMNRRCNAIGLEVEKAMKSGLLRIQKVDPAELSPGAFSGLLQKLVTTEQISVVVIDSLNGYIQAMPQEQFLTLQLHELFTYLNNHGIVTLMTLAQHGMVGSMQSPVDLTYLADTVILTRFFEANGAVKKAISVIKKRTGAHEDTIREFAVGQNGVKVGPALSQFQGILTGVPRFHGESESIMKKNV
ncbi:MAG: ATPase domain-containing protein [Bdellovibrionota bacterium]